MREVRGGDGEKEEEERRMMKTCLSIVAN